MNGASRWLEAKALLEMASRAAATTGAVRNIEGRSSRMSFLLVLVMSAVSRSTTSRNAVLAGVVTSREMLPDANDGLTAPCALTCIRFRGGLVAGDFLRDLVDTSSPFVRRPAHLRGRAADG